MDRSRRNVAATALAAIKLAASLIATSLAIATNAAAAALTETDIVCSVADPTGTPLNVRDGPGTDAAVTDRLRNGTSVYVMKLAKDARGRQWALVELNGGPDGGEIPGWVFTAYLRC